MACVRKRTKGTDEVYDQIKNLVEGVNRSDINSRDKSFYLRIDLALRNLNRLKDVITFDQFERVKNQIDSINLGHIDNSQIQYSEHEASDEVKLLKNKNGKRDAYVIDKDLLEHLISLGSSVASIAKDGMLGAKVHPNTIHNFMKRNKITSIRKRFTSITDNKLARHIKSINLAYPNSGIREVKAMLMNLNPPIKVQRDRVAKLLAQIDPVGTTRRWAKIIPRRVYRVASPNSLWHIDTHHKLIRWNFVVDGCIDGYSRLVVVLQLHTNNLASSMLSDFLEGITQYGIPSRVRADKGSEFVHINRLMEEVNGVNRGSFMTGKSVHNIRIERLWRDVFTKVLEKYYNLFTLMEEKNILDVNDEIHLACLHHVFGRCIQRSLSFWKAAHNIHPISSEGSKTPKQLWFNASLSNSNRNITAMDNISRRDPHDYQHIIERYRSTGSLNEPDSIKVVLPRFKLPIDEMYVQELEDSIDVLRESPNDGVDIYGEVMRFVYDRLK